MVSRLLAPQISPLNLPLALLDSLDFVSPALKACSFSLHFFSFSDRFRKENLCRSLMKAFRTEFALDSLIFFARLANTSSTPMSFLAEVSKNEQHKVAAIFFPSWYETSLSSSRSLWRWNKRRFRIVQNRNQTRATSENEDFAELCPKWRGTCDFRK